MILLRFLIAFLLVWPAFSQARTLGPRDVLRLTAERSLAGQEADLDPQIAAEDLRAAKAQYDLRLKGGVSYTDDWSERSSTIFGTQSTEALWNAGAAQLTPSGAIVEVNFNNQRQTSNSPFAIVNPMYDARVALSVTQPILKNYFGFATRRAISLARVAQEAAVEGARAGRLDIAYGNLILYWNWFLQHRLYELDRDAVSLAEKTLRTNQEKLSLGLIERIDLFVFAANLDMQKDALLMVKEQLLQLSSEMRAALDLGEETLAPAARAALPLKSGSLASLQSEALGAHPLLNAIRKDLEAKDIALAVQKNAKLPQVDLNASLALNGVDDDYDMALGDIHNGNSILSGGVSVTFPLQNRAARAAHGKLELQKKQKLLSLRDAENKILAFVRHAWERYRNNRQRVGVAASLVENQRKKWEGEIERYNQGRSSPDMVIRFQDEYVNARKRYVQAAAALEVAKLDLLYATGTLGAGVL